MSHLFLLGAALVIYPGAIATAVLAENERERAWAVVISVASGLWLGSQLCASFG